MTQIPYAQQVQSLREKLYRIAYCYVKNEQQALDIVSSAVYKGYLARSTLQDSRYFATWMTRIVIHCALDHCRKEHVEIPLEEANERISESDFTPEDRMDLYAALDTLSSDDKTLIILKYFEDFRFCDIAKLMQLPESTVKTRMYRILKYLRIQLDTKEVIL